MNLQQWYLSQCLHGALNAFVVQVDLALVPAVSGDFGVMPGHVPTIAELRPGVVAVHKELDKDVEKYFVSGGFAFAHADSSVELTAVEATKVEDIDPAAVKAGLAEYTARFDTVLFLLAQHQHNHCLRRCPCCCWQQVVAAFMQHRLVWPSQ